jgi:phosphoglycerate dehydrogenase-like enzyme
MTLVIASQLEPGLNDSLRRHPVRPDVITVPEESPWDVADSADVLLVRPSPTWRGHHHRPKPDIWPGRLRWVYSASVGMDFYPRWLLDAPMVTCGRGVASDEIADYVIAAIYARAKDLDAVTVHSLAEWIPAPLGRVSGTTVGIVGFGAIGSAVARRALALGAQVVAARRGRVPVAMAGVELLDSVEAVVATADHIVIAVPATSETYRLFDAALLARARPGAHIINIARGSVIDQDALVDALDGGRLDFATLDVTDPEPLPDGHALYTHPRVRLTPHVSSNYMAVRHRLLDKIADDISRFARGEAPSDIVDPVRGY